MCMVLSTFPMAFAIVAGGTCTICDNLTSKLCSTCGVDYFCDTCEYCNTCGTIAYGNGTEVKYNAELDTTIGDLNGDGVPDNQEYYTVTVPARLVPSENENSGHVVAAGTWASNRKLLVSADTSVRLINSLNTNDYKDLDVIFNVIGLIGNNTMAVSHTELISVALMPSTALFGTWSGIFYYDVEMIDNVTAPEVEKISFTIDGYPFVAEAGLNWLDWAESEDFVGSGRDFVLDVDSYSVSINYSSVWFNGEMVNPTDEIQAVAYYTAE